MNPWKSNLVGLCVCVLPFQMAFHSMAYVGIDPSSKFHPEFQVPKVEG